MTSSVLEELLALTPDGSGELFEWMDVVDVTSHCWDPQRIEGYDYGLSGLDNGAHRNKVGPQPSLLGFAPTLIVLFSLSNRSILSAVVKKPAWVFSTGRVRL